MGKAEQSIKFPQQLDLPVANPAVHYRLKIWDVTKKVFKGSPRTVAHSFTGQCASSLGSCRAK